MGNAHFRPCPVETWPTGEWHEGDPTSDVDRHRLHAATTRLTLQPDEVGLTQALLVVQDGRIVSESYGPGGGRDRPLISWSIAKSVTAALVGIAVGDGVLSVDDSSLRPEWAADERSCITLHHLLTMSSGLAWAEDYVDAGVSDVIEMLFGGQTSLPTFDEHGRLDPGDTAPNDAAGYAAAKYCAAEPGSEYRYSSGTTNIVCEYLGRRLGERPGDSSVVARYMHDRLFSAIGMSTAVPRFDRRGTFVGSSYVYATTRDFARFGLLHLAGGTWNGHRILPVGWVEYSSTPVARDPENSYDYGAHWWMNPADPGSMCAKGFEGQHIWLSSRRGIVVVRLGRTTADQAPALEDAMLQLVESFPARDGSDK